MYIQVNNVLTQNWPKPGSETCTLKHDAHVSTNLTHALKDMRVVLKPMPHLQLVTLKHMHVKQTLPMPQKT
jgi:hypothetical protein